MYASDSQVHVLYLSNDCSSNVATVAGNPIKKENVHDVMGLCTRLILGRDRPLIKKTNNQGYSTF